MYKLFILGLLFLSANKSMAQESSVIEFPIFESITPKWTHLTIDSSLITSVNNGTGHFASFIASPFVVNDSYLFDINYSNYYEDTLYVSGFKFDLVDILTGNSVFSFTSDLRDSDYEEVPIGMQVEDNCFHIFTARDTKIVDPNLPIIVFNGLTNLVRYTIDLDSFTIIKRIYNEDPNSLEFIYPGSYWKIPFYQHDTTFVFQQYGVLDGNQPTLGYVLHKVLPNQDVNRGVDTLYMKVNDTETSNVSVSRGRYFSLGNYWMLNHSRLSEAGEEFSTFEVLIINKKDLLDSYRINCNDYFSVPSDFRLYPSNGNYIYLSNDENSDPRIEENKMVILDQSGSLIESISEVKNENDYYYQDFYPFEVELGGNNQGTYIIAQNYSQNCLDVFSTDGSGNLIFIKSLKFINPKHRLFINEVLNKSNDTNIYLKGFIRKDTIINGNEELVGRWNFIFSIPYTELDIKNSTKDFIEREETKFIIYPNPASETINIKVDEKIKFGSIYIANSLGSILDKKAINNQIVDFDIRNFNPGHYYIIVTNKYGVYQSIVFNKM